MRTLIFLLAPVAAFRLAQHTEAELNPMRRVITALQNMQKEMMEEARNDKKLQDKFNCYCSGGSSKLAEEISQGGEEAKRLAADIDAKTARKAETDNRVGEARKGRSDNKDAMAQATAIRKKEKAAYDDATAEFKDQLDGLNGAIAALNKGMGKAMFIQTVHADALRRAVAASTSVMDMEKQEVLSLLSTQQESPYGDYAAGASGTDQVVGICQQLKDDISKQLGGVVDQEEKAVQTFTEMMDARAAEIAAQTKTIEEGIAKSGQLAVEITEDKNTLKNTDGEMAANREFLNNLNGDCETKQKEFDERTKLRNEEVSAVSEAIKILNDDDALDMFKKTLPSTGFTQSFIQKQDPRIEAYASVQSVAVGSHRPGLSLIAYMLRSKGVDFSKVVKMIDDMRANLNKEQKDDDEQLSYCNSELKSAEDNQKQNGRDLKGLSATIDELTSRISELESDIEETEARIKSNTKALADAKEQRIAENKQFEQEMLENQACQQLIKKAENRLNKFYNPAAYKEAPKRQLTKEEQIAVNMGEDIGTQAPEMIYGTSQTVNFVQKKPAPAPETGSINDRKGKGTGVLAMLKMLLNTIEQETQESQMEEAQSQKDYEKLAADAKASIGADKKSLVSSRQALADTNSDKNTAEQDKAAKTEEGQNIAKGISDLHGSCDFLVNNFEVRKSARASENDALANAKAILSGANFK